MRVDAREENFSFPHYKIKNVFCSTPLLQFMSRVYLFLETYQNK